MSGPPADARVLDVTSVIMGPCATARLGDMGADVVKVEPPAGDAARRLGPARTAGMSRGSIHSRRGAARDSGPACRAVRSCRVMPYTGEVWSGFFSTAGRPDLAADPRFSSHTARHEDNAALQSEPAALNSHRTVSERLTRAAPGERPHGRSWTSTRSNRTLTTPARDALIDARQHCEGARKLIRFPVDFTATPVTHYRPASPTGPRIATVGWLQPRQ